MRRSRSANRRSKSKSKSPVEHYFKREIKINLAAPKRSPSKPDINEEHHHMNFDEMESRTTTVTSVLKPSQQPAQPTPVRQHTLITSNSITTLTQAPEVQEEVLLNLFSCTNSGSISSESSESLVDMDEDRGKLKINEVYEKKQPEPKPEPKRANNQNQLLLEKKLAELEKKLQKLPELEIKNNILQEEKQILIKQLLNMKQQQPAPVRTPEPAKVYRSIGCNSEDYKQTRDIGTEAKALTRDVGLSINIDEPKEEIAQMQTIITTLRDKLNEQTLIMQQQLIKPQTRDVAVMHVVDKVEEQRPKPEYRDVAINHRTEIDNKEEIEKQLEITNNYIKEIEILRLENTKLSSNLEELIRKHTKHVVTRGTHAPEQPVLYSVGTNTKKTCTRDVQVMFTPKSRDVSLSTDRFYHTRDVGLSCALGVAEQQEKMQELIEIRSKYELMVEESRKQIKSYRDVSLLCNLDFKEHRTVALGCNIEPCKRDVSMRCNLDEEFRSFRDVNIGCQLDVRPEQKDASIFVNTYEPVIVHKQIVKEKRDFCANVLFEDMEKVQMAKELVALRLPKPTRDVAICVDSRSRFLQDLVRNQSSSMESVKTFSRTVNTETRNTRDSSVGSSCSYDASRAHKGVQITDLTQTETTTRLMEQNEKVEIERNKLIELNNELRQRLKEIEDRLIIEKQRSANLEAIAIEQSKKQYKTQGVGQCTIFGPFSNTSSISTSTSSLHQSSSSKTVNEAYQGGCLVKSSSNNDIRGSSAERVDLVKTTVKKLNNLTNKSEIITTTTTTTTHGIKLTPTGDGTYKIVEHYDPSKKSDKVKALEAQLACSISKQVEKGNGNLTLQIPCGNLRNEITIPINNENLESSGATATVTSSSCTASPSGAASTLKKSNELYITNVIVSKPPVSPSRGSSTQATSVNDKFVTESSELITYRDGEIIEKKIFEKVELKKPKGILKSSTMPVSSSSAQTQACNKQDEACSTQTQVQQRKIQFGENEILEK